RAELETAERAGAKERIRIGLRGRAALRRRIGLRRCRRGRAGLAAGRGRSGGERARRGRKGQYEQRDDDGGTTRGEHHGLGSVGWEQTAGKGRDLAANRRAAPALILRSVCARRLPHFCNKSARFVAPPSARVEVGSHATVGRSSPPDEPFEREVSPPRGAAEATDSDPFPAGCPAMRPASLLPVISACVAACLATGPGVTA